jgi:hypothetical protein
MVENHSAMQGRAQLASTSAARQLCAQANVGKLEYFLGGLDIAEVVCM